MWWCKALTWETNVVIGFVRLNFSTPDSALDKHIFKREGGLPFLSAAWGRLLRIGVPFYTFIVHLFW